MSSAFRVAALWLFAAGCSDKPTTDARPEGSGPAAAVTGVSSASPEAPVDRSPLPVTVDKDIVRLHVVAYREDEHAGYAGYGPQASNAFRVHPFRDRMVVTKAGHVYLVESGKLTYQAKAVTAEKVEGEAPIFGAYDVERLEGSWPDELFVDARFESFMGPRQQSSTRRVSYRRAAGKWAVEKSLPPAVSGWMAGSVIGLSDGGIFISGGSPEVTRPRLRGPFDAQGCSQAKPALEAKSIAALPSGEVFVLGKRCDSGRWAVERFAAGQSTGAMEELPGAPDAWYGARIVAGSPTSVFAVLPGDKAPYVARFDGRAFRTIALPDVGVPRSAWATPDGALFVVTRQKKDDSAPLLVRYRPDGSITRFAAPQNRKLHGVWASDADTAYTAWDDDDEGVAVLFGTKPESLLGTAPAKFIEDAPAPAEPAPAQAGSQLPAYTDDCSTPFVFLYDITSKSPLGFDFPTTRRALASFEDVSQLKLVEFVHDKQRKLGVRVPSAEVGRALMKHVVAKMEDEAPELVCYEPQEGLRDIPITK